VNAYVAAGYGVTLASLAAYAGYVLHRARSLRARVGPATPRPRTGAVR
jgi:hypothetical protein